MKIRLGSVRVVVRMMVIARRDFHATNETNSRPSQVVGAMARMANIIAHSASQVSYGPQNSLWEAMANVRVTATVTQIAWKVFFVTSEIGRPKCRDVWERVGGVLIIASRTPTLELLSQLTSPLCHPLPTLQLALPMRQPQSQPKTPHHHQPQSPQKPPLSLPL